MSSTMTVAATYLMALWALTPHPATAGESQLATPCADLTHCLRSTAVGLLDVMGDKDVPLLGGTLSIVRDPKIEADPIAAASKDLSKRVGEFLRTRRILVKMPQLTQEIGVSEGRKKDKGGGYGAMAMIMGGTLLAMGFSALAALAGKALAASMAALMMAAMAALKKHGGGGHSGYEVITVGEGHHHRSLHLPEHEHQEELMQSSYSNVPYSHESYPRSND